MRASACGCGLVWSRIEAFQANKNTSKDFEDVIDAFRVFCLVDTGLKTSTSGLQIRTLRRLLQGITQSPLEITPQDLRAYLVRYLDKSTSTYADQIKTIRVFLRAFLSCGHMVERCKLPQSGYTPKKVPSKDKRQTFNWALEDLRDQALLLLFATSGLRKAEVLSLTFEDLEENRLVFQGTMRDRVELRGIG